MNDLPPSAVEHLYPVLVILGLCIAALAALIGGLWVGFKWLQGQITTTAQTLISPVHERVVLVEKSVEAAHQRIDKWLGARP